jgi:hypothetical protein
MVVRGTQDDVNAFINTQAGDNRQMQNERRVLGEFPLGPDYTQNLLSAVDEARAKKLSVDIEYGADKVKLIAVPAPREADWPAMLGESPRKNRVIADKAWQRLGLKVVPASSLEQFDYHTRRQGGPIKILGGNVPKGLPLPAFVRRIGENSLETFDDLHAWLNEQEGRRPIPVKIYAFADGHEYLFDAEPPAEQTAQVTWPTDVAFSSPEDGAIAMRAWKELGIKTAPLRRDERNLARAHGYDNGLKLIDFHGFPQLNGPFILTEFSSKTISARLDDFADLQAILDAFSFAPAEEIAILKGVHRGGKFEHSLRRPQEKLAVDGGKQSRFPSLEEQKLADLAWRMLQLELEPADEEELKRVRALGYQGGVLVTGTTEPGTRRQDTYEIWRGDVLVGLHVWPTTSLKDVAEILQRDDLADLNPLKFYVVRGGELVITGRISVRLPGKLSSGRSELNAAERGSKNSRASAGDLSAYAWQSGNNPPAASENEIKVHTSSTEPATSFAPPEAGGADKHSATSAARGPKQPSSSNKRPDAGVTIAAESQEALDEFMRLASSPQAGESISVLKRIALREQQKYDRLAELAQNNAVSAAEVETQKANYEISRERLRQAQRALEYHKAQVALAVADYEAAVEASKKARGAVSELELRKLQLKVQAAEAMYKTLAE